jgi:cephalosporin-C deacetylase
MNHIARRWSRVLTVLLVAALSASAELSAQQLTFTPDRESGIYGAGERVGWTVARPARSRAAANAAYEYTVRRNGGEVISTGRFDLRRGRARIETTLAEPAMVLVEVRPVVADSAFGSRSTGGPGRVLLGAAVDPTGIRPAEPRPADFDSFWHAKVGELTAIPMDAELRRGESGREGVEFYTVRMRNVRGAHVHGQLARPVGEGPFPAMVLYQWASPPYPLQRSWVTDRAAEGWLVLNIQPHDVPADMPQAFYDALPALIKNYPTIGRHSRDESHFLQMYLADYRAVEYITTRPDWDGNTLLVTGTSMGGQQSFVAAGLHPSVTAMVVHVPAGADVAGTLHGRAQTYPFWEVSRPEVLKTARYFDVAHFASGIRAPSLVSMGFIDEITTPASIWSAFNQITGPKEAVPLAVAHHNHIATQEQQLAYTRRAAQWLEILVRGGDPME